MKRRIALLIKYSGTLFILLALRIDLDAQRPGVIDDFGDTVQVRNHLTFCLGDCYQFVYLPWESAPDPNLRLLETDSVWWLIKRGTPTHAVGRNVISCFDTLSDRDTILLRQRTYDTSLRRMIVVGIGNAVRVVACPPIAGAVPDRRILCEGEEVQFSDGSRRAPKEWYWEFEGGEPAVWSGPDPPPVRYPVPGTYSVRQRVRNELGADTMVLIDHIEVISAPRYRMGYSAELELPFGARTRLQSCYTGDLYEWFPSEGLSCTDCPDPELVVGHQSWYRLTVRMEGVSCVDTCYYRVETLPIEEQIFFPGAFTPNGDGINDRFEPQAWFVTLEELRIYDRWGNEVYMHKGSSPVWDGHFRGKALESGTYVFYAVGWKEYSRERVLYTGELQLIR
jgi:gliding motility-associated-like protein